MAIRRNNQRNNRQQARQQTPTKNINKPAAAKSIPGYTGGPIDRTNASSNAALDQFYYGQPNPTNTSRYGTKATPGYQDIDGVTFSPEALAAAKANNSPFVQGADYNKWAAGMATTSPIDRGFGTTAATSPAATQRSYKDINSIRGGLKIGGNNVLGAGEARRISRATGRPQDKVIAKALESGFGIGGNLVNQSNKAFRPSMNPLAIDPLAAMRGIETGGKGQMFAGTYQLDGQQMPIVQARGGGANPLGMGAGGGGGAGGRRGGKGKRGQGGAGGAADMGATASTQQQPMTMDAMLPQDMAAASSDININMPGVGEELSNWATGFKSKRSRRRMAGRQAQGLASQRINPLGAWRFAT